MEEILHTRTPSRVSRFILRNFGTTPERKAALLAGTGLTLDTLSDLPPWVSVFTQRTLIENTSKLLGEDWALRHIEQINYENLGLVGQTIATAPTLSKSLDVMGQIAHYMAATLYMDQIYTDTHRHIAFGYVMTRGTYLRKVSELTCAFTYSLLAAIMGHNIKNIEIWFSFAKPPYAGAYTTAFKCPVKFGKPYTAFVFPNALTGNPSLQADPEIHAQSLSAMFSDVGSAIPAPGNETVDAVKRFLNVYSGKRPTSDDTAAALRMSRRSLTRKLREAGTSFRVLLDQSLKDRAGILEGRGIYSRDEIAEQLGYSDVTSYGRARRRWHNQ